MEAAQRMVPLTNGKRTGITLDQVTWQAIEWLSGQKEKTWQQWCSRVIEATPAGENTTAAIRAAAMDGLLSATIFEDRGQDLSAMEANSLTRNSVALNDRQLKEFLKLATVQGKSDFDAFEVIFGHDEHGEDFLVIKNGMRDSLHFATLAPEAGK